MAKYCCEEFDSHIKKLQRDGVIDIDVTRKQVHVEGCCGGQCNVLYNINFCPYCGTNVNKIFEPVAH